MSQRSLLAHFFMNFLPQEQTTSRSTASSSTLMAFFTVGPVFSARVVLTPNFLSILFYLIWRNWRVRISGCPEERFVPSLICYVLKFLLRLEFIRFFFIPFLQNQ